MTDTVAWGILGTGNIAGALARAVNDAASARLVGVGSRTAGSADAFGERYGVPNRHASYEALLEDPDVEVVYVSMPHHLHAEWTIRAAGAGKHVLCEKPFAVNARDAEAMVAAARRAGVFLMEAFQPRVHPQARAIHDLVTSGALGEVRVVQASHGFYANLPPTHRVVAHELAGGGILDVGCYTAVMTRLVAGAAAGRPFADPLDVRARGRIGERTRVDEWATADLEFPGGLLAQLACGIGVRLQNDLRVCGTDATLVVPKPYGPAQVATMSLLRPNAEPEEVRVDAGRALYTNEVERVSDLVRAGALECPEITLEDTLGNMRVLDAWRAGIGLVYDFERA
jgi:predicted dehydrogenase